MFSHVSSYIIASLFFLYLASPSLSLLNQLEFSNPPIVYKATVSAHFQSPHPTENPQFPHTLSISMQGTLTPLSVAAISSFAATSFKPNPRMSFSFSCTATATSAAPHVADPHRRATAASSLYNVLRVKHDASAVEIKAAYRNLAKLHHPDAVVSGDGSGTRDFIEIHNAYATLSDPSSRALYDLSLGLASSRRGRRTAAASSSRYSSGFYPTRRWETDQCW